MYERPPHNRQADGRHRSRYGSLSLLIFVLTFLLQVALSVFEGLFIGMQPQTERALLIVLFVLVPIVGVALGVLGVVQPGRKKGWALAGLILNSLTVLFFLAVLSIAG